MQALDVEEIESLSKIDVRDVSWWMSIRNVGRPITLVTAKLSKGGCISLTIGGKPSRAAHKHD
jgi:hypothetical protein